MVRNLLDITRIDAGGLELRWDWVDLHEVVERVVSAARRRGSAHKIETDLPSDLPLLRADAALVEQVIGNVVGNAIAHTPNETRMTVGAAVTPETVSLTVTDEGPGIDSKLLPHVFDKFVRARSVPTMAEGGEGTGLGLAIAKGVMEAHGGSIAAESPGAAGRGTRIILKFPRVETPA